MKKKEVEGEEQCSSDRPPTTNPLILFFFWSTRPLRRLPARPSSLLATAGLPPHSCPPSFPSPPTRDFCVSSGIIEDSKTVSSLFSLSYPPPHWEACMVAWQSGGGMILCGGGGCGGVNKKKRGVHVCVRPEGGRGVFACSSFYCIDVGRRRVAGVHAQRRLRRRRSDSVEPN